MIGLIFTVSTLTPYGSMQLGIITEFSTSLFLSGSIRLNTAGDIAYYFTFIINILLIQVVTVLLMDLHRLTSNLAVVLMTLIVRTD